MIEGYAIRDKHQHGWLKTRIRVEKVAVPVTVWTQDVTQALTFRHLKDAKAMLKVIRQDHRRPEKVHIMDPRWRVIV